MSDLALQLVTREQAGAALAKLNQRRKDHQLYVDDAKRDVIEAENVLEGRKQVVVDLLKITADLEAEGRIIMHFLDLLKNKAGA